MVDEQPGLSGIRRRCGQPLGGTLGARLPGPLGEVVGRQTPTEPAPPCPCDPRREPRVGFGVPGKLLGSDVRKAGCSQAHDQGRLPTSALVQVAC